MTNEEKKLEHSLRELSKKNEVSVHFGGTGYNENSIIPFEYQTLSVAEECLEYEFEMHKITSFFEAQKEAHKNKMLLLKSNRLAFTAMYEQGVKLVRYNGADWVDCETGVVMVGIQSLAQAKTMHKQLSLDFKKEEGLDD
jgi:hypothetical protein